MNRCTRCLIPDSRPDTYFEDGVCSACLEHDRREVVDWHARREELAGLLARHRRHGAEFDCIVPSSGGKDSHAQVLTLLELDARPLVVTATTCHLTPIGRRNIDNLARYATTLEASPNKRVRATLNRLALELVGDISWPEHVAIHTVPFKVAVQMGIPLVFYGENPLAQYGGPPGEQAAKRMTRRWVSEFGGFLGLRPSDLVGMEGLTARDMSDYTGPSDEALEAAGVEVHFLGQYIPWDSHANAEKAKAAGMEQARPSPANWWAHENLDNAQTGLHDWMMYRKYGYGRGCAQISVDIRRGLIGREEARIWLDMHDGEFPMTYAGVPIADVLERVGLSMSMLLEISDQFAAEHEEAA